MVNRQVVGAGYGLKDWLIQRITAVIMLVYVLFLLAFLLLMPTHYPVWQDFFAQTWVRIVTQIAWIAIVWHAWVGMRDIWMDYVQNTGLRVLLHSLTALWLIGTLIYSLKVIWGIA